LQDMSSRGASPIPADMPPLSQKHKKRLIDNVEDIGVPVSACFFTRTAIDPVNWYFTVPFGGRGSRRCDVKAYLQ